MRRGCGDSTVYEALRKTAFRIEVAFPDPAARLAPLCDALWEALSPRGLSWIGFYLIEDSSDGSPPAEMLLAARRDKPACSPIGLHGVCGQGFVEERIRLVEDVGLLGGGYIACDPRDRSELVVPVYRNGKCWGVLDADSHEIACFGDLDIEGVCGVLRSAGLLDRDLALRADRIEEGHLHR